MLLDEPFGGLDALTRASMQEWLLESAPRLGSTFVLVTHDVEEAVLLSDRVYVLSQRPARVVLALDVDLPGPRGLDAVDNPRFGEYRRAILEALRQAGALAEPAGGGGRR
jgi:ABC-type nitrate/sulfonate/bicarbonate transport system ATPase subunit